ncbi:hypothetical protein A2U01_0070100, partial [Trifolium medium]|nr:hypothetical protein [Trifolium medium]
METGDDLSWEKLKRALIARYGGTRTENPFEELSALKQTGSVTVCGSVRTNFVSGGEITGGTVLRVFHEWVETSSVKE